MDVLQTPLSLNNWLIKSSFSKSSRHLHSQTGRARDLKLWENVNLPPCVTCHISHVTCLGQSVGASQWRVCYQRGLPRLVWQITHTFHHWEFYIFGNHFYSTLGPKHVGVIVNWLLCPLAYHLSCLSDAAFMYRINIPLGCSSQVTTVSSSCSSDMARWSFGSYLTYAAGLLALIWHRPQVSWLSYDLSRRSSGCSWTWPTGLLTVIWHGRRSPVSPLTNWQNKPYARPFVSLNVQHFMYYMIFFIEPSVA